MTELSHPSPDSASTGTRPVPTEAVALGWQRLKPWLIAAAALLLCLLLAAALHGLAGEVRYDDVMRAIAGTHEMDIVLALMATAASYLILSGYDFSALAYAHARVNRGTVLLTSFTAYALSNTIGLGPLTGGAVRTRLYTAAGLKAHQVAQVVVFNAAAFGLGITAFGAVALLWGAPDVAGLVGLPPELLQLGSGLLLVGVGVFLALCRRQRNLQIAGRWRLRLPPAGLAVRQLVISAFELTASAAALWFLLPGERIDLPAFTAFYAIAIVAGIISHVPGGVGVFEAVMLMATRNDVPADSMLAALVLYRGIYYIVPLVAATALVLGWELKSGVGTPIARAATRLSPRLLAALTLVAGLWLIASGVTPFTEDAREMLATLNVPLPLVEASHFLGSVAGLGLLLVARGLFHRLDAAWWAALVLAVVSAVLALPKGIALHEAGLLATLAVLLVVSRKQFDRRSSLLSMRLEPGWLIGLGAVLAGSLWLLFFAYQEVAYTHGLWWQFELDAQAPRSLRALLGVALAGMAYGLWQLLRPPVGQAAAPTTEDLDRAAAIVAANPRADACFALTGDKHLLFSPSGRSFLMYGKQNRSWIALYGPAGDKAEWAELAWRFVEMARTHGGRPAFYQVRPASLPLYLDCGLQAFKLGEHAHIELPGFDLKGAKRANLRSGMNRGEREGLVFEVIEGEALEAALPELRAVSDAWLSRQKTREKGFSVGRFDEDYLRRLPVAVARREGCILAFANLLVTAPAEEAAVDLMRHLPDAPPGTMDFLFAKVLLHLKDRGFQRFALGMAPMAGMAERRHAPRWQRLGRLLYEHGERFYNFRGLRSFKDKFEPVWEPRYLAAPGGVAPLWVLLDLAALIGGGTKGVIGK